MPSLKALIVILLIFAPPVAFADEKTEAAPEATTLDEKPKDPAVKESKSSPWLITPLISSDPKLSTALGVLGAYVHQFDEKSPPSLFGVAGTYSTTDSWKVSAFTKVHFGEDKHRVVAGLAKGELNNDYEDYLGSGLNVKTTDDISLLALRYAYGFYGRWYFGPQFVSTNYAIIGDNAQSGAILEYVGLTGFRSNGLGLYTQYDSRDNQYSPLTGQVFEAHNFAYREELGGDVSFDALTADYQYYIPFHQKHVLALHAKGRWTNDAPPSGYSSIDLRGYTRGQYLAPHSTMAEADYRHMVYKDKVGAAVFGGVSALYGDDTSDEDYEFYPAGGVGLFYVLNDQKMVVRADFAVGSEGNHGFYLQFGNPF
jgi:hypothetical protein